VHQAETGLLLPPEAAKVDAPTSTPRGRDEARRARIVTCYDLDDIGRRRFQRRLLLREALSDIEARVEAQTILPVPPTIEWETWTPARLNRVLRALFERVQLGPNLTPMSDGFVWRMREWRRA